MIKNKEKVLLGKKFSVHQNALVGYKPLRKLEKSSLKIGSNLTVLFRGIIYLGSVIGDNAIIGHNSIVREENVIGDNFKLWNNSIVDYGCKIGNNVKIHCNVYVAQYTTIEDNVFLAPGTIIANDIHPGCPKSRECIKGPLIKKGAKIGANVTLNPRITIGRNVLIGSGSVVINDIPDEAVAVGNPAKVIKSVRDLRCVSGLSDFPYHLD